MSRILFESQIIWKGIESSENVSTLLDTGSSNNYIDEDLASFLKFPRKGLSPSLVGLGGSTMKRCGPLYPTFIVKFNDKIYKHGSESYITPLKSVGVIIGSAWIHDTKLSVNEIIEYWDGIEYVEN